MYHSGRGHHHKLTLIVIITQQLSRDQTRILFDPRSRPWQTRQHPDTDPDAAPCPHRYFFDVAALNASTAQAWIDNAYYAETAQVAGYIANGGLPLVISEWTLAGARARGPDPYP